MENREDLDELTESLKEDFQKDQRIHKWSKSGTSVKKLYELLRRLPPWRKPS